MTNWKRLIQANERSMPYSWKYLYQEDFDNVQIQRCHLTQEVETS